jgi:hypothetical protein
LTQNLNRITGFYKIQETAFLLILGLFDERQRWTKDCRSDPPSSLNWCALGSGANHPIDKMKGGRRVSLPFNPIILYQGLVRSHGFFNHDEMTGTYFLLIPLLPHQEVQVDQLRRSFRERRRNA